MTITIREATPADEAMLVRFLRDLQDAECAICASRRPGRDVARSCYEHLQRIGSHILIAEHEGRAIGFVAGRMAVDDDELQLMAWREHGYVSDLFVVPAHRRRGVGQRLLAAMAAQLRGEGARRLRIGSLSANHAALAAYARFGFRPFEMTLDLELS